MLNKKFISQFLKLIKANSKICVFCHVNPDYDTLGCGFGLFEFLKLNFPNKSIKIVDTSKINNIRSNELFKFDEHETNSNDVKNSLGIVVDVSEPRRILGSDKLESCSRTIVVDHHPKSEFSINDLNWIDTEYPACCQMIVEIIRFLNKRHRFKINSKSLTYLYAGLLTDTNRFLFDSVNVETYELTSWLVKNGVNRRLVHDVLYINSIDDAKRKADFFNLIKINKYGVGSLFIDKEFNKKYKMSSFCDAISIMSGYKEIKVWTSCYFNEDYQTWNCSLRSRDYPIVNVAQKYGGGGHLLAAGCRINGPEVFGKLIKDLNRLIIESDNNAKNN